MPETSTFGLQMNLDAYASCSRYLEIVASVITFDCDDCIRRLIQQMENMMKNLNYPRSHQILRGIVVSVAAAVITAACASAPPPIEQMAVSRAALNNANSAGANEFAPIQLKSAVDKMQGAEQAMTAKDYPLALQLAEEAEVDAKLAGLTARSIKAQKAADAVQEDSRVLRKEIDRQTK